MDGNKTPLAPVTLRSGVEMPALGFGTWHLGENRAHWQDEAAALLHAIDVGFTHFDTAEMYGEGATERLLGEVIQQRQREGLFLTSKVYPWNADGAHMVEACDASLKRLQTDYLDLYLLHWPGGVPFEKTLEGAEALLAAGKIRAFGVSNFDAVELQSMAAAGLVGRVDVNQVMYNPARRGIEFDLLPALQANNIACVAYTPLEPNRIDRSSGFKAVASEAGLSPAQLALAWHMTRGAAVPIPKASRVDHVDALLDASSIRLSTDQLDAIDTAFPPPRSAQPLDII